MIVDSLRYWVSEMHVDGFRFDLASILTRDPQGQPAAEPADALGYRVRPGAGGHETHRRGLGRRAGCIRSATSSAIAGREWNGQFRDDVRDFFQRRRRAATGRMADRMLGSPNLYRAHRTARPDQSVNFVTCHDGFTLNDLVSYNDKHNDANGESNRDGSQRQSQLELRRRRADRRSGRSKQLRESPGEELSDR